MFDADNDICSKAIEHHAITLHFGERFSAPRKFALYNNKKLDPLRAKKTIIRKKLGHTVVSAIKTVRMSIWICFLNFISLNEIPVSHYSHLVLDL